ncbi:MAG TPA: hypothetical protein VHL79_12650, partial [Ramlibacter sp.]|nr:hypothetical protein [Ramlibacter sp.]
MSQLHRGAVRPLAASLALSCALLLAACGGGSGGTELTSGSATTPSAPASAPSVTPPAPPPKDVLAALPASTRFAYSTHLFANSLAVLAVDPENGTQRVLATHQANLFYGLAADPQGRYLYANAGNQGNPSFPLSVMTIDPQTGGFSATTTAHPNLDATRLGFSPFGDLAFKSTDDAGVRVFRIGGSGVLSEIGSSPGARADSSFDVKVHPSGKLLFVSSDETFAYDPQLGQPAKTYLLDRTMGTVKAVARTDPAPGTVLWLAGPQSVWVRNQDGLELLAVDTGTGLLSRRAKRTVLGLGTGAPFFLTVATDTSGKFLLVSEGTKLQAYAVDADAGTVTAIGAALPLVSRALQTARLNADERTGRFHLGDLIVRIDASAGVVPVGVSPLGNTNAALIGGAPLTKFPTAVYGIDSAARVLRVLWQDEATGVLSPVGSPKPLAGVPQAVAVGPAGTSADAGQAGTFVLVATANGSLPGTLARFTVDKRNGAATPGSTTDIGPRPTSIATNLGPWNLGYGIIVGHEGAAGIDFVGSWLGQLVWTGTFPVAFGPPKRVGTSSNGQPIVEYDPISPGSGVTDLLLAGSKAYVAIPNDATGAGTPGALSTLNDALQEGRSLTAASTGTESAHGS